MSDKKKLSKNQKAGDIGENEFRNWAGKAGFSATKFERDLGFDFFCQVEGEQDRGKKSWVMPGHVFMVSVRSTKQDGDAIKLKRADADLLLSNDRCVLAIVKRAPIDEVGKIAIKFVDEEFIKELDAFLKSNKKQLGVCFSNACTDLGAIRYNVDRMFKSDFQSKLTCLKKMLKLEEVLKSPRIKIVHGSDGGYAVVQSESVFDNFDVTSPDNDMRLQEAAFGRYDQLCKRLKELPLHPKILEVADDFPPKMILQGGLTANVGFAELEVAGAGKTVRLEVETRAFGDWVGYVHASGLRVRFSCACEVDGQHVHHIVVNCDPETPVGELSKGVAAEFLAVCRENDAKVFIVGSEIQFTGKEIDSFRNLGHLIACYQLMPDWRFIRGDAWPICKITGEDCQSMAFLGDIIEHNNLVSGFGFALGEEPVENLVKYPREVDLPVCMNLRGHGVVCWITAKVNLLVDPSKVFVGLEITQTLNVRFEHRAETFPTEGEPLLKVSSGWGGIPLTNNKMKYRGVEDWGVQMHDVDGDEVIETTSSPRP